MMTYLLDYCREMTDSRVSQGQYMDKVLTAVTSMILGHFLDYLQGKWKTVLHEFDRNVHGIDLYG